MENNTDLLKNSLSHALLSSGELLLEYYDAPIESDQKESRSSIVTEADLKSEKLIIKIIQERFPWHNIISEECGFIDHGSEFTWIIDPLDGTSNFVAGIPWFGVLISIFMGSIPIIGGAFLPVQKLVYIAEKGKGAFRNGQPLPRIRNEEIGNTLVAFCVDYTDDEALLAREIEMHKFLVRNARNIRSTNSLMDFIYVAENRFGGVVNFNTRVWDIAPFTVIIPEVGGIIRPMNGNEFQFSIGSDLMEENFPVISGNRQVVESLIKM